MDSIRPSSENTASAINKISFALASPQELAYRLGYLLYSQQKEVKDDSAANLFFRITKKGLEMLAKDNKTIATTEQYESANTHKLPISEAYIACTAYELECIDCCLVKADKEYLIGTQSSIKKLKKLTPYDEALFALSWESLQEKVQTWRDNKEVTVKSTKKTSIIEGDEQQVLLCIWLQLLNYVEEYTFKTIPSSSNKIAPLTYKTLCKRLSYQLHQNGLASYLYSIAQYCQSKQLPRLDYLVVKEGTGFPDGILATDIKAIKDFHDQLEQVVAFVKEPDNSFPSEPSDLKFEKRSRAKKASKKQPDYSPL